MGEPGRPPWVFRCFRSGLDLMCRLFPIWRERERDRERWRETERQRERVDEDTTTMCHDASGLKKK